MPVKYIRANVAPGISAWNIENNLLPELQQVRGASSQISTYEATLLGMSQVVLRNNNLIIEYWFVIFSDEKHLAFMQTMTVRV